MISVKNLTPKDLAQYQQSQTGNSCAVCSACAAINLLFGTHILAPYWIQTVDNLPVFQILNMRLFKNGPTTPQQQMNLIRWISGTEGISSVNVRQISATREELLNILQSPNQAALVTIGWLFRKAPEIVYGSTTNNYNALGKRFGYHTMLAGAYHPTHICADGLARPWGFINSWTNGGDELFWMSEAEFLRSWSIFTPFGGIRSTVVITRTTE